MINFPNENIPISESEYNKLYQSMKDGFDAIELKPEYINSILELLEGHLTYVPFSTSREEVADISLYDHMKLTSAIAASIYLFLSSAGRDNYKNILFENEKVFRDEKALLMFSCDISGIQQFIYTISSKGVLKGLRSRSFYLEIILEHVVDGILSRLELSRANLIYTGGGHAYMLLPNTGKTKSYIKETVKTVNQWFLKNFGTSLYIAADYVECSCNDLMNIPYEEEPYINMFKALSEKLSANKLKRYSAQDIRILNSDNNDSKGRECRICGSTDLYINESNKPEALNAPDTLDNAGAAGITELEDGAESLERTDVEVNTYDTDICTICSSLEGISSELLKEETLLITAKSKIMNKKSIIMPCLDGKDNYLYISLQDGQFIGGV